MHAFFITFGNQCFYFLILYFNCVMAMVNFKQELSAKDHVTKEKLNFKI